MIELPVRRLRDDAVVLEVPELELVEVDDLSTTERGVRGHGSSGA